MDTIYAGLAHLVQGRYMTTLRHSGLLICSALLAGCSLMLDLDDHRAPPDGGTDDRNPMQTCLNSDIRFECDGATLNVFTENQDTPSTTVACPGNTGCVVSESSGFASCGDEVLVTEGRFQFGDNGAGEFYGPAEADGDERNSGCFLLDRHEVSTRLFVQFLNSDPSVVDTHSGALVLADVDAGCHVASDGTNYTAAGDPNLPVNCVGPSLAEAYCVWANPYGDYRLPSEFQFEYAAVGPCPNGECDSDNVEYAPLDRPTTLGTVDSGDCSASGHFSACRLGDNLSELTASRPCLYDSPDLTNCTLDGACGPELDFSQCDGHSVVRGGNYAMPATAEERRWSRRMTVAEPNPLVGFRCSRTLTIGQN